jgi:uncharacterized membrane protein YkoI
MRQCTRFLMASLVLVIGLAASMAGADDKTPDHDTVRRAVERGEIKPLAEILAAVRSRLPGEVLKVEVESKRGRWLYELRVADANGRIFEVYVDGLTARIERIEKK